MIGVAVTPDDLPAAREFFELFKTPWEPVVPGRTYRAVVDAIGCEISAPTKCVVVYGSHRQPIDEHIGAAVITEDGPAGFSWKNYEVPIFGRWTRFAAAAASGAGPRRETLPCGYRATIGRRTVTRVGYDLFAEVRTLLSVGQPPSLAQVPTLDLHIDVLRTLLLASEVPLIEVPPCPFGQDFVACLTHDIDFVRLRHHVLDRTFAGFAARATVGTLRDCLAGRRPPADLARNWGAVLSLPLVLTGTMRDPWHPFADYRQADGDRRATFFVIPFKGKPGISPAGRLERARAAPYKLRDIADDLHRVTGRGDEVALHGIDAWRDAGVARAEAARLGGVIGKVPRGVRMHWLYFHPDSPQQLEHAGFSYDSTWGYNDAIGYRSGTLQPFRFPQCDTLIELPLAIMDTALFYRDRMGLAPADALSRCQQVISHAKDHGGALVVNWHDRSLAPERLWGRSYRALLDRIGSSAWFATASDVVAWFRWRRSVQFGVEGGTLVVSAGDRPPATPPGRIRVHLPGRPEAASDLPLPGGRLAVAL